MSFRAIKYLLLLVLATGLPMAASARALTLVPFATTNQSPLVAVFGLPPAGEATVLPAGRTAVELRADIASNFTADSRSGESILLDGESYRLALALRYGFSERLEFGLEIPYVLHRQGFLDRFIINWHDFFNLPQGGRDQSPRNRLEYRYVRSGSDQLDLTDETDGLGDLRLTGGWQLWRKDASSLALRASLKVPTGDADRLLGSGSTDFALWLSGSETFADRSLALFGAAGALVMSDGDVLADRQRNAVAFGTLGGGWRPFSRVAFKAQVDAHSPFYRGSDLRELSGASAQLAIGGTVGITDALLLDIAVTEDIVVDTAPDVVFHFSLRQTF
jgi:hypothetical protein